MSLDAKIPSGPLETKWSQYKSEMTLVAPANKRRYTVIVVGTGLAGFVQKPYQATDLLPVVRKVLDEE